MPYQTEKSEKNPYNVSKDINLHNFGLQTTRRRFLGKLQLCGFYQIIVHYNVAKLKKII